MCCAPFGGFGAFRSWYVHPTACIAAATDCVLDFPPPRVRTTAAATAPAATSATATAATSSIVRRPPAPPVEPGFPVRFCGAWTLRGGAGVRGFFATVRQGSRPFDHLAVRRPV